MSACGRHRPFSRRLSEALEVSRPGRLELTRTHLSPRLSLQLYAQALLSTGDYGDIKELSRPRTFEFPAYGREIGSLAADPSGTSYLVDPDGTGPAAAFSLPVPDFNLKALRANAVLRWEFRPGSAVYLVWTERRQDRSNPGDFGLGRDVRDLLRSPSDDVFMVKVAWWVGR